MSRSTYSNKMKMTDEQKKFLLENHEQYTTQQLAGSLNVSYSKAQNWLSELGIKKKKVYNSSCNVSTELFNHNQNLATI